MKKYIVSDPNILSGMPVIAGTRVPIARILFLLKEGYTVEAIHDSFPHVPTKKIEKAISELVEALSESDGNAMNIFRDKVSPEEEEEEAVQLSEKASKRYEKMDEDIRKGKSIYYAKDVDDLMKQLHGDIPPRKLP